MLLFKELQSQVLGIQGPSSSTFSFQSLIGKTQHNIGEIVSSGKDDYSMGLRLNSRNG